MEGVIREGEWVLVIVEGSERRREYMFRADPKAYYSTFAGPLSGAQLVGAPWGSALHLSRGRAYLLPPTLRDMEMHLFKRAGQVIYPKDLGYILVSAGIRCGMTVLEAGVGSGFLTAILASVLCCGGRLIGYDIRREAIETVKRNLALAGLDTCVDLRLGDVRSGVPESGLDAVFLDLPDPWRAAKALHPSLKPGAPLVAFLPTYNQVEKLAAEAGRAGFVVQEVVEIMRREIEAKPGATRPSTRMIAHTGFVVLLRRLTSQDSEGAPSNG